MTCARCHRLIVDTEKAPYSVAWRKNYCPVNEWKTCDRLLAERLQAEQTKDAA